MRAQLNSLRARALAASVSARHLLPSIAIRPLEALGVETPAPQMLNPARFPEPRIELPPPTEGAISSPITSARPDTGSHPWLCCGRAGKMKMKLRSSYKQLRVAELRVRAASLRTSASADRQRLGVRCDRRRNRPSTSIFWNDIFERERKVVVGSTRSACRRMAIRSGRHASAIKTRDRIHACSAACGSSSRDFH